MRKAIDGKDTFVLFMFSQDRAPRKGLRRLATVEPLDRQHLVDVEACWLGALAFGHSFIHFTTNAFIVIMARVVDRANLQRAWKRVKVVGAGA